MREYRLATPLTQILPLCLRSPHAVVGGLFLPEPLRPSLSHRRPELAIVGDLTQEIACTRIEEASQFLTVHGIAVLRLMPAHEDRRLTPREVDRAVVIDECITLEPQRVVVRAHGELKRLPAIEGGGIDCIARRSAERGTLDSSAARFVDRTLSFSELTASEVMTPRGKVTMLEDTAPVAEVIELARSTGHSRFPLYREDRDNIVGVVHVKKAVGVPAEVRETLEAGTLAEDVLQVPETLHVDALLTQLREGALQLAVVLDEYGGTAGITTLEDLVEEIVGEVSDEHDVGDSTDRPLQYGNGDWVFSGLRRPGEINNYIPELTVEENPEYETVGGFMMERLGRIPDEGDTVPVPGGTLRVDAIDGRRVDRIRFIPDTAQTMYLRTVPARRDRTAAGEKRA